MSWALSCKDCSMTALAIDPDFRGTTAAPATIDDDPCASVILDPEEWNALVEQLIGLPENAPESEHDRLIDEAHVQAARQRGLIG